MISRRNLRNTRWWPAKYLLCVMKFNIIMCLGLLNLSWVEIFNKANKSFSKFSTRRRYLAGHWRLECSLNCLWQFSEEKFFNSSANKIAKPTWFIKSLIHLFLFCFCLNDIEILKYYDRIYLVLSLCLLIFLMC